MQVNSPFHADATNEIHVASATAITGGTLSVGTIHHYYDDINC